MKSGLEDRNNVAPVNGYVVDLMIVSMKSGLEDRNNTRTRYDASQS